MTKKKQYLKFIAFALFGSAGAFGLAYEICPRVFPDWLLYIMLITGLILLIAIIVVLCVEKKCMKR